MGKVKELRKGWMHGERSRGNNKGSEGEDSWRGIVDG